MPEVRNDLRGGDAWHIVSGFVDLDLVNGLIHDVNGIDGNLVFFDFAIGGDGCEDFGSSKVLFGGVVKVCDVGSPICGVGRGGHAGSDAVKHRGMEVVGVKVLADVVQETFANVCKARALPYDVNNV